MKNIIAAITLSIASGAAMADGFAPWDNHTQLNDANISSATVNASAFAPWNNRVTPIDMPDSAIQITDINNTVFRPWS